MIEYFVFLRGINVGGKNVIKMEDLRQIFADCGFTNVKSYIQSGNIVFQGKKAEPEELVKKIEKQLYKSVGANIPVMLRTREQLEIMIKIDPFKQIKVTDKTKFYVVFLSKIPTERHTLPIRSEKDGLELISIVNAHAYLISYEINGRNGFPNNFIEKLLKVNATSRYWNTILKMMEI
jgi:uncharacterized protein (DUF1697 family)